MTGNETEKPKGLMIGGKSVVIPVIEDGAVLKLVDGKWIAEKEIKEPPKL